MFRGSGGLWNNYPLDEVATIEAFRRNPNFVHKFMNNLKSGILSAQPNAAHFALTKLQTFYPYLTVNILTQNIDLLHEKAGNKNVYHIHGQIDKARCQQCGNIVSADDEVSTETVCPSCKTKGKMRPHIVFFHEPILHTSFVGNLLEKVDLFIAVGTSGSVYPAASFAKIARRAGAKTIMFNIEPTQNEVFDEQIVGDATETLPKFVDELIANQK